MSEKVFWAGIIVMAVGWVAWWIATFLTFHVVLWGVAMVGFILSTAMVLLAMRGVFDEE